MKKIDRKIKKTKKKLLILYLLIISIILTSCVEMGGRKEIEDLGIVTAIGIDYIDEKVVVTLEVVNPLASSGSSQAISTKTEAQRFVYPQGKGDTIKEAITDINLYFDKKIFLSHSDLLVLGEEFAKRGIIDLMDYFIRDSQPREDMYIVVAKGAKASDIVGVKAGLGRPTGTYLYETIDNFSYTGRNINISVAEIYRYYYDVSNEPVIGVVQLREVFRANDELKKEEPIATVLDVAGGAVLSRDRLIGYFDSDEMIGFNFIVGDFDSGVLVFSTPVKDKDKKQTIIGTDGVFTSVDIINTKTKRKISINNGKIHLTIDVKAKVALNEINQALDVIDAEVISRIEKACSDKIKELISNTLDKGQKEFKQDSFSIGVAVHQQHPKVWKEIATDWHNIFPEITYDVNVETTLFKIGLMNFPANLRRKK